MHRITQDGRPILRGCLRRAGDGWVEDKNVQIRTRSESGRRTRRLRSGLGWGLCVVALGSHIAPGQTAPQELLLKQFEAFDRQVAADSVSRPTPNNDSGGLAWGAAYTLTAYAEMVAATENPAYAKRFVTLADGVLAQRDDRRNVTDAFRGKVVPAWRPQSYPMTKRYGRAVHRGSPPHPKARSSPGVLVTS